MKSLSSNLLLLFFILFTSNCGSPCRSEETSWRRGAHEAFTEFQKVNNEIINNAAALADSGRNSNIQINKNNVERMEFQQQAALKQWFETKENAQITIHNEHIIAYYQMRKYANWLCNAYLIHAPDGLFTPILPNLKGSITDNISLGNNWFYVFTECHRCDLN